jgi:uridine monophosphate synthetase
MNFFDKLNSAIAQNQSLLYIGLDPHPETWSLCYEAARQTRTDDSATQKFQTLSQFQQLQDWLNRLIEQTQSLVCAYKLNPELYRLLGTPGLELLFEILRTIPPELPVIWDAKHGDLNTSTLVAQTIFQDWQVDAVTLNAYVGQDLAAPFLVYPDKTVFVLCTTTNPSARVLQEHPDAEQPFYLRLIEEAKTWGTLEQVGLEVGAVQPSILARIRAIAPERVILARSVWTESSDFSQTLEVGLNSSGGGLLIPVSPEVVSETDAPTMIRTLRDEVNRIRETVMQTSPNCALWMPDVCLLQQQPHEHLILQLFDIGCLQFGEFVQASGAVFPYYIDLRTIISNPQIFEQVIAAYADILETLAFDRIAGIPYGALPTATGLALRLNRPMIFPRKEVKAHGARRLVEGHFEPGETAVVVDDILISGNSAMEGAGKLQSVGLQVQDIVVFIDHEKGVKDRLKEQGYQAHAVLTISEIAQTLYAAGRLADQQFAALGIDH